MRNLLLYVLICVLLGGIGLYFAYGPLSSDSFFWEWSSFWSDGTYRNLGGWLEFIRLLLLGTIFVVGNLSVFRNRSEQYWSGRVVPMKFLVTIYRDRSTWLKIGVTIVACMVIIHAAIILPYIMFTEYKTSTYSF